MIFYGGHFGNGDFSLLYAHFPGGCPLELESVWVIEQKKIGQSFIAEIIILFKKRGWCPRTMGPVSTFMIHSRIAETNKCNNIDSFI